MLCRRAIDGVGMGQPTSLLYSAGGREPLPHRWPPGRAPVIIDAMTLLRYAAFLGLAVWIGGLAALAGLGAPVLFEVLPAHDPAGGRELAGVVFGTLFERFQYVAWGAAIVVLASLSLRAALGPRPRRTALRIWTVLAMVAMSVGHRRCVTRIRR